MTLALTTLFATFLSTRLFLALFTFHPARVFPLYRAPLNSPVISASQDLKPRCCATRGQHRLA